MKTNFRLVVILFFIIGNQNISSNALKIFAGPLFWGRMVKNKIEYDRKLEFANNAAEYGSVVDPKTINENFDTVIVEDNVRDILKTIVEFLRNPMKYHIIGAKIPKGILLYGPPGTGKTSLGRALAKEAGCNFLYMAGSEIDDKWVGTGSEKIKKLFDLARTKAPAIIFIDEIDVLAKNRSFSDTRFHIQTMQQLMVEMDGFKREQDKPVVVIGTTNRIEYLDQAMLRPGRFDIHLKIDNPSLLNKKKIFLMYLSKIKLSKNVTEANLDELCKKMDNFSGADIESVVNKATLRCIMSNKSLVELSHLNKALNDMIAQKLN